MAALLLFGSFLFLAMRWGILPCLALRLALFAASAPVSVVIPFALLFAIGVTYLIDKTDLWTDALLNIIYSASLAVSVILLSVEGSYQSGIGSLLFGDILATLPSDLLISGLLLLVCLCVRRVNAADSGIAEFE